MSKKVKGGKPPSLAGQAADVKAAPVPDEAAEAQRMKGLTTNKSCMRKIPMGRTHLCTAFWRLGWAGAQQGVPKSRGGGRRVCKVRGWGLRWPGWCGVWK